MKYMIGKKIIIIGCSGSGKSYFARQLNELTSIPLYYLDCIYWKENWTHLSNEQFDKELNNILAKDQWIIDGNYSRTLELRLRHADTVFFLDMPIELCVEAENKRRGTKREDLPSFLEEKNDPEFVDFIKTFKEKKRPMIISLLDKYSDKNIITFTSREEKEIWLDMYNQKRIVSKDFKKILDNYFESFKRKTSRNEVTYFDAGYFGMTKESATTLAFLILSGKKRATSSALLSYQKNAVELPKEGSLFIVTSWLGKPLCIIETKKVSLHKFKDMTYELIKLEGEDDNLQSWVQAHTAFFKKDGIENGYSFDEDMIIVFEEFTVVYKE